MASAATGADVATVAERLAVAGLDWDFLEGSGRDVLGRPGVRAHCAVWEVPAAGAEHGPRWEGWSARGWLEALGMALACWRQDRTWG